AELGALTREKKSGEFTMRELGRLWQDRLSIEERVTIDDLMRRFGREPIPEDRDAAREGVTRAMDHSFERASVLPERTLIAESLRQSFGKASPQTIRSLVEVQPLIRANRNGRSLV